MWPLLACSLAVWAVVLERLWRFRRLSGDLRSFHLEAMNHLLAGDVEPLRALCQRNGELPTAQLLHFALERLDSKDARVQATWKDALDRRRLWAHQDLKRFLWLLGTIASAAPFIGLFGTVVGILRSFGDMARTGSGGFTVVAGGISEALIATAAGLIVAIVAVLAYNAFQVHLNRIQLLIRLHVEEWSELLAARK
jgi:biopolymer transport protein ExbB